MRVTDLAAGFGVEFEGSLELAPLTRRQDGPWTLWTLRIVIVVLHAALVLRCTTKSRTWCNIISLPVA